MSEDLSLTSVKYGNDVFADSCKIIDIAKK